MRITNRITGTTPVIIHSPGLTLSRRKNKKIHARRNPLWKYLNRLWSQSAPPEPGPDFSGEMTIITWNTSPEKSILELSLDKLGITCTVLGQDHKNWSNALKMELAIDFLESVKTPYVLALDAYDVLVLDTPANALETFKQMDCDILFNASRIFYPDFGKCVSGNCITDTWKHFQEQVGVMPWSYINAGACIAKTDAYLKFARDCRSRDVNALVQKGSLPQYAGKKDQRTLDMEQVRVNWCFMDWYPRMQADYQSRIFMTTKFISRKDIRIGLPAYKIPCEWAAIHADHLRVRTGSAFKALLGRTRKLRGRLGLRQTQWKKR